MSRTRRIARRTRRLCRSATRLLLSRSYRTELRRRWFWRRAHRYSPLLAAEDGRGNRFVVSTRDPFVGRELFVYRDFDPALIDSALALLSERGHAPKQVFNAGANIGATLIDLLSRLPDASGVACEPDADNYRLLRHNILANGLTGRASTFQTAVSDQDGTLTFEHSPSNPGDHRVRLQEAPGAMQEEGRTTSTVPARRIDSLVAEGELDPELPSLIWLDTQGHEAHVLAGAERMRHNPTLIEFWPYGLRRAGGYDRLLEIIADFGTIIEIYGTEPPRVISLAELRGIEQERSMTIGHTDLLLLP